MGAQADSRKEAQGELDLQEPLHDPVCGMVVLPESPHRLEYAGQTWLFCSSRCAERFDAEPRRWASQSHPDASAHGTHQHSADEHSAHVHAGHKRAGHTHAEQKRSGKPTPAPAGSIYTCPMHPEIRQDRPGTCPKCGMALEPELPSLDDDNPELRDFSRRFWWTLPLTAIVFVLAMFGHRLHLMDMVTQSWVELVLTTPVVLLAGAPFFVRGWQSVIHRSPNMWTLIALGTGAAYVYS